MVSESNFDPRSSYFLFQVLIFVCSRYLFSPSWLPSLYNPPPISSSLSADIEFDPLKFNIFCFTHSEILYTFYFSHPPKRILQKKTASKFELGFFHKNPQKGVEQSGPIHAVEPWKGFEQQRYYFVHQYNSCVQFHHHLT